MRTIDELSRNLNLWADKHLKPRTKPKEEPPTPPELRAAVHDCFYAANECTAFHFWDLHGRPALEKEPALARMNSAKFFHNGQLEAVLMFFRKTQEFFQQQDSKHRPDSLYAYRWNFPLVGQIFPDKLVRELHQRVGHITLAEARYGKIGWPDFEMMLVALHHWILFFEHLAVNLYSGDPEMKGYCLGYEKTLRQLRGRIEQDRPFRVAS